MQVKAYVDHPVLGVEMASFRKAGAHLKGDAAVGHS
jgi:hypothetical protein